MAVTTLQERMLKIAERFPQEPNTQFRVSQEEAKEIITAARELAEAKGAVRLVAIATRTLRDPLATAEQKDSAVSVLASLFEQWGPTPHDELESVLNELRESE